MDGIATNAFTNVVPTFPTRSSVQEHSVWTFSKDRGVRPGYPTVDLMPQPSTSRPIWSTGTFFNDIIRRFGDYDITAADNLSAIHSHSDAVSAFLLFRSVRKSTSATAKIEKSF